MMKSCVKCEEEKPTSMFSKHADTRDKLDPRCKACVRLVKQNPERQTKPRELDIVETNIEDRAWQGGKKKGSILNKGNGLFMASVANKASKCFRLGNFQEDEMALRNAAIQFLYSKSLELGLTTNRYKIIGDPITNEPQYLLVQLSKNYVTLCDYDMLECVKNHHFFVTISGSKNQHRSHYVAYLENDKNVPFHKGITGFEMTDHINRYPMDNRRRNLRETNCVENNRNRTNHYKSSKNSVENGTSFNVQDKIWNAHVIIDGETITKSFPLSDCAYKEAKEKAGKWCDEMIKQNSSHPIAGAYTNNNEWRARIKINNEEVAKSFSIKRYGFEEAKAMAIEWRKMMAIEWRKMMAKKTDNYVSKPSETGTNRHPDFFRLQSEFEEIMMKHALGCQWREN